MSKDKEISRRDIFILSFLVLALVSITSVENIFGLSPQKISSSELGIYNTSPLGESGGRSIPASCPADNHDDPSYGQSCAIGYACGTTYGAYQCGGWCSAPNPNPGNYGASCTSAGNACGQTQANGAIQCDGSCSSTPPDNSGCNQTVYSFANEGGSISPAGYITVGWGGSIGFDIYPNAGRYISSVFVDGHNIGTPSSYTFDNVTSYHDIGVNFGWQQRTISASAGTGGTISPSGVITLNYGNSQGFTITPSGGYVINRVFVNGGNQGAISSYTFNNVTTDQTISVEFNSVAVPSITGPTVGNPRLVSEPSGNQPANVHQYSFNSTSVDPQGHQIRYGIDWSEPADGVADEWLPAGGSYVNSGQTLTASHIWPTTGSHSFKVLAQDEWGLNSSWTTHTITLSYECADGSDNDGDGYSNSADPGCHSDSLWDNAGSYVSSDNNESDEFASTCNDHIDNNGTVVLDCADPVCHINNDLVQSCSASRSEGVFDFQMNIRATNEQGVDLRNLILPPGRPIYIEWTATGTPTGCTLRKKELQGNTVATSLNMVSNAESAGTILLNNGTAIKRRHSVSALTQNTRFEITCSVNTSIIGTTDVRVGRVGSF